MEKDGSKRSRVDDVDPVVEIISRQPTSVSNIAHFVKEFIESEENLLEAEKKAHAEAVQELEELVVKEGHDPEFQPDFLSVEMLRAQQKVLDTEPTVDEDALRRLDNLQFFFQDRVAGSRAISVRKQALICYNCINIDKLREAEFLTHSIFFYK